MTDWRKKCATLPASVLGCTIGLANRNGLRLFTRLFTSIFLQDSCQVLLLAEQKRKQASSFRFNAIMAGDVTFRVGNYAFCRIE